MTGVRGIVGPGLALHHTVQGLPCTIRYKGLPCTIRYRACPAPYGTGLALHHTVQGLLFGVMTSLRGCIRTSFAGGDRVPPLVKELTFTHIFCWTPGLHGMHAFSPKGAT